MLQTETQLSSKTGSQSMSKKFNCVSIDLEVTNEGQIRAFGALNHESGQNLVYNRGDLDKKLTELDDFAKDADFIIGHNIIEFDLPILDAARPELQLLKLPRIDTLRLNPLAFPRNPYHHLVKHYQDGGIKRGKLNDPELDARLTLGLFEDQLDAFPKTPSELLAAWHWLCTPDNKGFDSELDRIFSQLRDSVRPTSEAAKDFIKICLEKSGCLFQAETVFKRVEKIRWELAYALAWISVAGGNSVMPPWVRHQFPKAGELVKWLRDTPCKSADCSWCSERHNAKKELKRWFDFDSFRPTPADENGKPLQQSIVEANMQRKHVLGILPTGTGKSVCYQVPALSRYDKTGALTVIISPLVALMSDQVSGLEAKGIGSCITINGMLSMPERADALDRVRLGDTGMLLISPEQLRSSSIVKVLEQREIGGWVLDEAHCLSRWGHDFRPDYRYIGRFIKKSTGNRKVAPILCLTATAKPDVKDDIVRHFKDLLDLDLEIYPGGAKRDNLTFMVCPTAENEKFADIYRILEQNLPMDKEGGAIIYCATRRRCEDLNEFLHLKDYADKSAFFHAKLSPERKKDVQRRFIQGELKVIVATNAFGMGIDKPDVRLVIHADIPGSLENYLQEAGRAGRDRKPAHCMLMYAVDDVERQFSMSAYSRLTRSEIHGVLRALRKLDYRIRRKDPDFELIATPGEILAEDDESEFHRDTNTDDTKVRTAVAWLEESELLTREENRVQIFPSSLRVNSIEEAKKRLKGSVDKESYNQQLLRITEALIEADIDQGISTDELMGLTGLGQESVRNAIYDLENSGIVKNDLELTAFVHSGVERSSNKRFRDSVELEIGLISHMREAFPDMEKGDKSSLLLRKASQTLQEQGLIDPLPEKLWRIVSGISYDGRGEDKFEGSISIRRTEMDEISVTLKRNWSALEETAERRRHASELLLDHLLSRLPTDSRGTDILVETTLGNLKESLDSDLDLKGRIRNMDKLLDRSLMWLHEQEVIRLNRGLTVFRPAMKIRMARNEKRGFTKADFAPLDMHYKGKVLQIHVMKEFAERGLKSINDANRLSMDYFSLTEEQFLNRWLPDRDKEINRETTPETWKEIVEDLRNAIQRNIVADGREQTNVLVLAGPGSGKTRSLVHRIAYLVRVKRERADSILALAYNRHAAIEIRQRLKELIGDDSRRVIVLTCHGLAMRLVGVSFSSKVDQQEDEIFDEILKRAIGILKGEDLPPEDADEYRERLLSKFRWILVDEYQDIAKEQYELISALVGRSKEDDSHKLTIFAVGDDDQNIYSFNGASVEYIRKFEEDYGPKPIYMVSNYRSTRNIVEASNLMIKTARNRMKSEHPIRVNKAREKDPRGGRWEQLDPVARGRVQILEIKNDTIFQAQAVMMEFERLSKLDKNWNWSKCAVIARNWRFLVPVQAYCELNRIQHQMADEEIPNFWRLRETRIFVKKLTELPKKLIQTSDLTEILNSLPSNPWLELIAQAIDEHKLETGGKEIPLEHFLEWLAEWGREVRRRQKGLLLLSGHRAKGLEFDHVAILDGGWDRIGKEEDPDAPRRLYYVAMTRARKTLTLVNFKPTNHELLENLRRSSSIIRRPIKNLPPIPTQLRFNWIRASLQDVDLSYPGRRQPNDGIHKAIASLSYGEKLNIEKRDESWLLKNNSGNIVGKMAKRFQPPKNMKFQSVKVYAIIKRTKDMSEPDYQKFLNCDSWDIVLPEFIFAPN